MNYEEYKNLIEKLYGSSATTKDAIGVPTSGVKTYAEYKRRINNFFGPAKQILDRVFIGITALGVDEDIVSYTNGIIRFPKAELFVRSRFGNERREVVPAEDLEIVINLTSHSRIFAMKEYGDRAVIMAVNYFKMVGGI